MRYYTKKSEVGTVSRYQTRQPYYRRTEEDIGEEMEQVAKQAILLALEMELEEAQIALRTLELEWLEDRVTLDDILQESMENSICHNLCVFNRK